MDLWVHIMLLAAGISALGRHDSTPIWVCENDDATFNDTFVPDKYKWVTWSFRKKYDVHDVKIKEVSNGHNATIRDEYEGRFNRIGETIGFTLRDVSKSDSGRFTCMVQFQDGTKNSPTWILNVEDATKLTPPSISKKQSGSKCKTYTCQRNNTNVAVDTYWIHNGKVKSRGETLKLCEDNSSEIITCVIETNCSFNYTVFNTTEDESSGGCADIMAGFIAVTVMLVLLLVVFAGIACNKDRICDVLKTKRFGKTNMERGNASKDINEKDQFCEDGAEGVSKDDGSRQHDDQGEEFSLNNKQKFLVFHDHSSTGSFLNLSYEEEDV